MLDITLFIVHFLRKQTKRENNWLRIFPTDEDHEAVDELMKIPFDANPILEFAGKIFSLLGSFTIFEKYREIFGEIGHTQNRFDEMLSKKYNAELEEQGREANAIIIDIRKEIRKESFPLSCYENFHVLVEFIEKLLLLFEKEQFGEAIELFEDKIEEAISPVRRALEL